MRFVVVADVVVFGVVGGCVVACVLPVCANSCVCLHLRDGEIIYAIIDNNFTVPPHKSAYRILSWKYVPFKLYPPHDQEIHEPIRENATVLLKQALEQEEQLKRYQKELPTSIHNLTVNRPLRPLLRDLRPDYMDTFQLIYNEGILDKILNKSNYTDLETYQHVVFLHKHNYITTH